MKTIIHVNQHKIRENKDGANRPVLTCKTYKSNDYAHEAIIYGQDGLEAARVVYRPNKPLSCGAKVWIETENKVETTVAEKIEQLKSSDYESGYWDEKEQDERNDWAAD